MFPRSRWKRTIPVPVMPLDTSDIMLEVTGRGLTPYKYIVKIWTSKPEPFIVNPIHQMPGLNT